MVKALGGTGLSRKRRGVGLDLSRSHAADAEMRGMLYNESLISIVEEVGTNQTGYDI